MSLSQNFAVYLKDILLANVKMKTFYNTSSTKKKKKKCALHSDVLLSGCGRLFLLQNETCDGLIFIKHAATLEVGAENMI